MEDHCFENIGWTVGNYCNAKCGHCYSWKVRRDSDEFLTTADVDRIIGQLRRLGIKTVNLGGNEPIYTHGPNIKDTILPYIIRRLSESGIPVGLTTNGVSFHYLRKRHPDELRMVNDIDFSLDSPFQEEHDLNRGNSLYKLTIENIRRAVDMGIDCSVIICGMRKNFTPTYLSAFLSLTKYLKSEFRINTLKPVEPDLVSEMPTAEQFYEGFAFLFDHSECVTLGESCLTAFTRSGTPGCPCGTSSFRINAKTRDGRVPINPCVYMHDFKAGDLLKDDIHDIIHGAEFRSFADRRHALPRACRESDCEYLESCRGGCSARSYLVYHSLEARDPYCPKEYARRNGGEPRIRQHFPVGLDEGIRVHDNYLCTWIGKVHEQFNDPLYTSIAQFLEGETIPTEMPLSGCRQAPPADADKEASLVRVALPASKVAEET